LAFTNCDISENRSTQGHGGALYVDNASTLSLMSCTMNNNYINTGSGYGGAFIITNFSQAEIVDTTFDGNYVDHDGSGCGGAMYVAWGSVANLSGKTVVSNSYAKAGGDTNALGGAVYINEGSSINIGEGVLFSGNSGTHGGAIYAIDTAVINVDGAVFTDNHTTKGNGGAIYCWRGPTLNAKNTTFLKNYTKSEANAYGGAVAIATGGASGTIESCVFEGNYTDNVGFCNGGALLVGATSKVTMSGNNVFKDNWGKSSGGKNTCGGAIYISDATLEMSEGTVFTGNSGTHGGAVYMNANGKFIVDGAKFKNNKSYLGHGGAVCAWNGGSISATNCSFTNNTIDSATGGYGGAVAVYNADDQKNTSVGTFTGCTFDSNYIARSGNIHTNGGAMYIGMGADVTVNGGSVFSNNYAKVNNEEANCYGGAIYLNTDSVLNLGASTFTNNYAELGGAVMAYGAAKVNVNGASFVGNYTTVDHGGAVYTIKTPTAISGSTFTKNYAEKHGGAVMIVGVEEGENVSNGIITNCTFNGNYSKTQRGGAVASFYAKNLAITGSAFNENYTNYAHGGAVFTQNMPVEIKSSTFAKNRVESEAGGYGGAVAIVNTEVAVAKSSGVITDCVFDGNYAIRTAGDNAACGGAVYAGLGTKLTINGTSEFKNNYVKAFNLAKAYNGGAVYGNDYTEITVADTVTFTNNTSRLGGAICTIGATKLDVTGAKFDANSTDYGHGGAIYAENTVVGLKGSTFSNNKVESTATGYGGAVAIANKAVTDGKSIGTITDCVFEGNSVVRPSGTSAANGGALYIGLGSKVNINGATEFKNNVAKAATTKQLYNGGAIYANTDCEVTIGDLVSVAAEGNNAAKGVTFTGNTGRMGGAIAVVGAAKLNVIGATFDGNYTNYAHGGAIYAETTDTVLLNSTFTGNKIDSVAGGYGGAVAIDSKDAKTAKTLTIDNCVFNGNNTVRPADGTANANGGALYIGQYTTANITGATQFKDNIAYSGKGVFNGGAIYTNTGCVVNVGEGVSFTGNMANNGGAIGAVDATAINLTGVTMASNTAKSSAAAVYYNEKVALSINGASVTAAADATATNFVIPAGTTLQVAGKVALGTVTYTDADSMIKLTGAVEGTATLIPAKYEEGFRIVKADDAALLAGISAKFAVAKDGETPWELDDEGKLKNMAPTVKIGETEYLTLDEALKAAKSGDEIVLLSDTKVQVSSEIPAGATIKNEGGYVITVSTGRTLTVNDGALKGATVIGDVVAKDGADLTGATVTGNVTAGANVVLAEATISGNVEVGADADLSKVVVGGAVTAGDNAKLVEAAVTGTVTAGANADLSKAVIGGNVTAGDNAKLNGAKITGDVAVANADVTDAAVTGKITVAANSVLTVGGGFTATEVYLESGATVNVTAALTAETKAFTLKSAVETIDTVLVTAPDAAAITAAVAKIEAVFEDSKVGLDETNGKIKSDVYVAMINGVGYESMKEAAAAAVDGDTILVRKSHTVDATIRVEKAITIDGQGFTLTRDADFKTAMIYLPDVAGASLELNDIILDGNKDNVTATEGVIINRGVLELNDVTIQNAKSSSFGAAIYSHERNVAGVKLTINGGAIKDSETASSGVIYVNGGTADINNTVISGNKAAIHAGAVYVYTGALTIDGAAFTNNEAAGNGGAILLVNDYDAEENPGFVQPTADIKNTTFTGNKTTNTYDDPTTGANEAGATTFGRGGAIYAGTQGAVTLTDVTAKGNSARQGGVMYTFSKTLTMTGGTYGGTADGEANTVTDAGGVFMTGDSTAEITITNGTYTGNKAANGPVFYIRANDTVTVNGGTFSGNTATKYGGAIYNAGVLTTTDAAYSNNRATTQGGAFYTTGTMTIKSGTFDNNGISGTGSGGLIMHAGGTLTIKDGTFTNNFSTDAGGLVHTVNGKGSSITVDAGTFTGNHAKGRGGVFYNHTGNTLTINGGTFSGNYTELYSTTSGSTTTSTYGGGVIWNNANGIAYIKGGTFEANGYKADVTARANHRFGGAIYNSAGKLYIGEQGETDHTKVKFLNNVTKDNGGAIYANGASVVEIYSGTISGSVATNYNGGAIWADCDVTIHNGVFTGNKGVTGGVFFLDAGTSSNTNDLTIHNGVFSANQATGASGTGGVARIREYTKLTVNGGIFGGDNAADGNIAKYDGGVFYKDAGTNALATITVTKTGETPLKFANNKSTGSGRMGGVFASASTSTLTLNVTGAEFVNNSCAGNGGVAYVHSGTTATFTNCAFTGNYTNRASGNVHGGALFVNSATTINGCSFAGNYASTGSGTATGGAIRHQAGVLNIDANTTFSTENPNLAANVRKDIYTNSAGNLHNNATGAVIG